MVLATDPRHVRTKALFHAACRRPAEERGRFLGRDGRFESDDYVIGGFAAVEFDRDIVWVDGYFIRWPTAKTADG